MLKKNRNVSLFVPLVVGLVLVGCTEDKAVALKTAAEAFRDKAIEAIAAFRELHIVAAIGQQSEAIQIQDSVRQIKAVASVRKTVTDQELDGAVAWIFARDGSEARVKALEDAKQAYVEFGAAFARLPEGSAFAANAVACSTVLGARLVHKLTVFHDTLVDAPIDYFRDRSSAADLIRKAAQSGNDAEIERATLAYIELRKTIRRDNEEARKKLAQAAEAGEEVLELARNYSTLDVADFLAGVTRILEIRAKHLGATADVSVQRVKDIRQRLESDSRLSPILKLPALNMIAECKR